VRIARLPLALACALVLSLGCARAPVPGEPIERADVIRLAEALSARGAGITGIRGSGGGEMTVSGRGTTASFAFVYSDPHWLRLDARPELGAAGHSLSSLSILDGQCLRSYFPARAVEVTGCLSDLDESLPEVDFAALALGIPRLAFLADLESATLARSDDALVLAGVLAGRRLVVTATGAPATISSLELELKPGGSVLTLAYDGRGWHEVGILPRSIEISITGGDLEGRLGLELTKAVAVDHVQRGDYDLEIPPAARRISWADLGLWRKQ
jgi:hypothetical protein